MDVSSLGTMSHVPNNPLLISMHFVIISFCYVGLGQAFRLSHCEQNLSKFHKIYSEHVSIAFSLEMLSITGTVGVGGGQGLGGPFPIK